MKFPKQMILSGTGNDGERHKYSFEKSASFKPGLLKFLEKIGLDPEGKNKNMFIITEHDENDEEVTTILEPKDLEDICWRFKNKEYDIDLFWGKNKVIMLVRTNQKTKRDRREKMLNVLEKNSDWISEKEIKERIRKNKLKGKCPKAVI